LFGISTFFAEVGGFMKTVMFIGKYLSLFVAQRLLVVDVLSQLFQIKVDVPEADAHEEEQEKKQDDPFE